MKTTVRRKLERKQQIQLSAIRIVNKYGFEKATMEQIAAELNMTKGALYYYFKNKEDLLYQCHHLVLSNALEELERILAAPLPADEKLAQLIQAHVTYVIDERDFFNLMIEPGKTFTGDQLQPVLALRKRYAAIFDEVIAAGVQEQRFFIESPFIARMTILGALNWIQQWYRENGTLDRAQIIHYFQQLIFKMIT